MISLILFSFLLNQILSIEPLSKYGSVTVYCPEDSRILFNSSEFNLNEEMYFTFTLTVDEYTARERKRSSSSTSTKPSSEFIKDKINYQFYPNNILNDPDIDTKSCSSSVDQTTETSSTSSRETKYNKYYAISKNVDNDYLLIEFDCHKCEDGELKIENTKENKGKQAKILIIVIIVVFVVIFIVVIVCVCIKRRQRQMAKASMQMAKTGMIMQAAANAANYYAQPAMGMGMTSGYGSGYAMNNMPPPIGNMGMQQPIAYSRVGDDVTQIQPKSPGQYIPQSSGQRIKKSKY